MEQHRDTQQSRPTIFLRAYDLDFDQVALNARLTHEEKIRLLVLLQHVWTNGQVFYFDSVQPDQLDAEIEVFGPEIEQRMAA